MTPLLPSLRRLAAHLPTASAGTLRGLSLGALLALGGACATTSPAQGPAAEPPAQTSDGADAPRRPEAVRTSSEIFVHADSGFAFPSEVFELRRGEIKQFDELGLDVGVGYGRPGVNVTVFLFPRRVMTQPSSEAHFEDALAAIRQSNPDAVLVERMPHIVTKDGTPVTGQLAVLELRQDEDRLGSILLVVPAGEHIIKLRATYLLSAGATSYMLSRLDALLDAVTWTPRAQASADR